MTWPLTIPFWPRVGFLLGLLLVVAMVEYFVKGRDKAHRWKEYGFLGIALAGGSLFGVLVDQVTSRISPAYFLYAKSLDPERFAMAVIDLGAKAGLTGGAIAGCLLLLAASHRQKSAGAGPGMREMINLLRFPIMGALLAAVLSGAGCLLAAPEALLGPFSELLDANEIPGFKAVLGAHYGLYLGGIIGTIVAMRRIPRSNSSHL